jgi:hypothetical protein
MCRFCSGFLTFSRSQARVNSPHIDPSGPTNMAFHAGMLAAKLEVGMKDGELQLLILRRMYDQRTIKWDFVASDFTDLVPEVKEFGRICFQLRDKQLIEWIAPVGDQFIAMSRARITTKGIDFIEKQETSELDNVAKTSTFIQMSDSGDRDTEFVDLLQQGRDLLNEHEPVEAHDAFERWVSAVGSWLAHINKGLSAQWHGGPNSPLVFAGRYHDDPDSWQKFYDVVNGRLKWLGDVLVGSGQKEPVKPEFSGEIFIVHGHDGELKHAAARLVEKLGLDPIILHEQPNKGRTIIEKFSDHAQTAGFAIVLLSADDEGRPKGTPSDPLKDRARQNVIFEMGFFFKHLGRGRVCAVYQPGVERPSDIQGILYVEYDQTGKWLYDVANEIKHAGYKVDLNKL